MDMIHATRSPFGSPHRHGAYHARRRLWLETLRIVTFWLGLTGFLPAAEEFCLLIEPKDGPPVRQIIKGAKMTALVPGKETSVGGVRYYTASEFEATGLGWRGFTRKAEAAATRVWVTLKPEVTKDAKGFVRSALIRGKSHLTASAVLSPKFYEEFRATMGDDLILLIPDRFTIHVFPRPMGEYKSWGPKILESYAEAAHPVSHEVLLLNKDGLSALGSFRTE